MDVSPPPSPDCDHGDVSSNARYRFETVASYIMINGETLWIVLRMSSIGSAEITIRGNRKSYEIPVYGAIMLFEMEFLICTEKIKFLGQNLNRQRASATSSSFCGKHDLGDRRRNRRVVNILDQEEAETFFITYIADDKKTISVHKPFKHEHLGEGWE